MFGNMWTDDEELSIVSDKSELWEEVCNLRDMVRELNAEKQLAEKKYKSVIEARAMEGKPILVINGSISYEDLKEISEIWKKYYQNGIVFACPDDYSLSEFDDRDLASVGLKRVSHGPVSDRDLYEDMLRGR